MFLLELGSGLQGLVEELQCGIRVLTDYRLYFRGVEYFREVECTRGLDFCTKSVTAQCCEWFCVELSPSGVWTLILHIPLTLLLKKHY